MIIKSEPDELYSQEAQQIIGREPAWVVRYGVYVVLALLLLLLAGSVLIRYPDVVSGKVKLLRQPSTYTVQAGSNGQLSEWRRREGDSVHRNEVIAVVTNDANTNDIYQLQAFLLHADVESLSAKDLPKNLRLGQVQPAYERLKHALDQRLKEGNVVDDERLLTRLRAAQEKLAEDRLMVDSLSAWLDKWPAEKKLRALDADVAVRYRTGRQKLAAGEEELSRLLSEIEKRTLSPRPAARQLLEEIKNWEGKYVLLAPADGRLKQVKDAVMNEQVTKGQALFRIDADTRIYTVMAMVPSRELGRLQTGQQGRIWLDKGFASSPVFVRAKVDSIGLYEGEDTAVIRLRLEDQNNGLNGLKNGAGVITGKADVILQKKSLLARLFKNINMFL